MQKKLENLKYCFDDSPVPFAVIEVLRDVDQTAEDFVFRYANRPCAALEGVALERLVGSRLATLPEQPERELLRQYAAVALLGDTQSVTRSFSAKAKQMRVQCYQLQPGFCACVMSDITAELTAKKELEETDRKLKMAVNHAKIQYWEYDLRTDTAYVGSFSQQLYHIPAVMTDFPESFIKIDACHPDSVESYRQMHRELKNGAPELVGEFKVRTQDDTPYGWTRVHYTTLFDEDGMPVRAIATASSMEECKELEEQFSTAVSQVGVSVWVYDFKTKRIHQKDNMPDIVGLRTNLPGETHDFCEEEHIHPEDVQKMRALYKTLSEGVQNVSETVRWRRSAAEDYRWCKICYTTIFDKYGRPHHAIGSAIDVSGKKHWNKNIAMRWLCKIQRAARLCLLKCVPILLKML